MARLADLFEVNVKNDIKELFDVISECMNVEDVIISNKNIAFTFKGYISNYEIEKLQQILGIKSFIMRRHNYEKEEIIFTYNSELNIE